MKTTLILNPEYKKLRSTTNILEIFATFNFATVLLAAKVKRKIEVTSDSAGAVMKLPPRRNSEASESNDGKIQGFVFVSFLFFQVL